jgi:hypothetical protein
MSFLIAVATEDAPSGIVCLRLLRRSPGDVQVLCPDKRQGGFPQLMNRIAVFEKLAKEGVKVLVLTDLDGPRREEGRVQEAFRGCAPAYRQFWLDKGLPNHPHLIFRIAVREVEAWALADHEGFGEFFGLAKGKIPQNPEKLDDPKATLLELLRAATGSRRQTQREACLPQPGAYSKTGSDYNYWLCQFLMKPWNIDRAAQRAPSLQKALLRLREAGWMV